MTARLSMGEWGACAAGGQISGATDKSGGRDVALVRKLGLTLASTLVVAVGAVALDVVAQIVQHGTLHGYSAFDTVLIAIGIGGPASYFWVAQRMHAVSLRLTAEAAQRQLGEAERRLGFLARNSSDIFISVAPDGRITYISPNVRRYGYAQAELTGAAALDLAHPDDREALGKAVAGLFHDTDRGDRQKPRLLRFRTAAGEWRWSEANPTVARDADGRPTEVTAVLHDITERKAALDAIVESEARFRMIADHATDIIIQFDAAQHIRYAAPACRQLGYTSEQLVGRKLVDFIHPDDLPRLRAAQAQRLSAARGAPPVLLECRILTGDGGISWIEGSTATIWGEGGEVQGAVAVLRVIDERKAAADAIAESESRYRMLANGSTDIIVTFSLDETIHFVSPAVRQLGYAPEDLVGKRVSDLLHPEDREAARVRREAAAAGRPLPSAAMRVRHADGHWVWIEGSTAGRIEGPPLMVVSSLRDVTDRVAAAEELAASEAQFRLLAENASDVISRCDARGVLTYISPSAERVLGYAPHELIGKKAFKLINPDEGAFVTELLTSAIAAGATGPLPPFEYRCVTKSGQLIWIEASPSVVRDPVTGKVLELQDCMRDITARKEMEAELRRKHAEAEAAAVAKAEFLANVSHELRTPLTGIIGFSSLLEGVPTLPEQAQAFVQRISSSSRALLGLVSDILDFSKMDARQIVLDPQPVDPAALLREALDVVGGQAAAKGLELRLEVDGRLPARVRLDGARLRQVVLNLLSNALKFTEAGEIVVTARHVRRAGGMLSIAVRDTGVGVPEGQAELLFERFTQADSSVSRRYGGTGLGLSICKALVELMGGSIRVDSVEGQGATFAFEVSAPAVRAERTARSAGASGLPGGSAGVPRVLITDDVLLNRELIKTILSSLDLEIFEADDGVEAVELCQDSAFDLILMDLQMPRMGGLDATRAIRAEGLNRDTPIVAVSANSAPEDVRGCLAAGMNDHIPKPISTSELLGKVAHWTEERAASAA